MSSTTDNSWSNYLHCITNHYDSDTQRYKHLNVNQCAAIHLLENGTKLASTQGFELTHEEIQMCIKGANQGWSNSTSLKIANSKYIKVEQMTSNECGYFS